MTSAPGENVKKLQTTLKYLGCYSGPVTGVIDNGTRIGIALLQKRIGIPPTGALDRPTLAAIARIVANPDVPMAPGPAPVPEADLYTNGVFTDFAQVLPRDMPGFRSDFEELVSRRNEAANETADRTGEFDSLGVEVIARDKERDERNLSCPSVRITPFTAYEASYGNLYECTSGSDPIKCAWWSGDMIESQPVTVTLINGGATDTAPLSTQSYRPYAIVNFFSGGGKSQATVDVGRGCQFTVCGSGVDVAVGMDSVSGATASHMLLGAQIGFFSSSTSTMPTRTAYLDDLTSAASQNIVVPNFGVTIQAADRAEDGQTLTLDFKDRGGNIITSQVILANQYLSMPITLPNDCYSIDVSNGGPTNTSARIVFGLSL